MYQYTNDADPGTFYQAVNNGTLVYKNIKKPLAGAFNNSDKIKEIFDPAITYLNDSCKALNLNPKDISIILYCTAGMRKLSLDQQKSILDDSYSYIISISNYSANRNEFRVIEGYEEALFAWIGVNRWINVFNSSKTFPIFEMGGASVQIAIEQTTTDSEVAPYVKTVTIAKKKYEVFCNSWLGYGYDDAAGVVHQYLNNNSITSSPCAINGSILSLKLADGTTKSFDGDSDYQQCYELYSNLVYKKDKNFSLHNTSLGEVPLSEDFKSSTVVYVLGVPSYVASFLQLRSEETISSLKQETLDFGLQNFSTAYANDPTYSFLNASFSQQVAVMNFFERGIYPATKLLYKLPIANVEPQWTLGAVLSARSPSVNIDNTEKDSTSPWVYVGIGLATLIVIGVVAFFVYPKFSKEKSSEGAPQV